MPVHQYGYARAAPAADRSRASRAQQQPVRRVRFIGTTPAVSRFRDFAEPSGPGIFENGGTAGLNVFGMPALASYIAAI